MWIGIKIVLRRARSRRAGAQSIRSEGFFALNFRVNRSKGRVLQEREFEESKKKELRDTEDGERRGEGEGGGDGTRGLDEKGW